MNKYMKSVWTTSMSKDFENMHSDDIAKEEIFNYLIECDRAILRLNNQLKSLHLVIDDKYKINRNRT